MWSPVHPALFATVDGMGHLDLWNLNNDTEVSRLALLDVTYTKWLIVSEKYLYLKSV